MRFLAVLLTALTFAGASFADGGYVQGSDGFFYLNGGTKPYFRLTQYTQGYWSCGRYYYGTPYYSYIEAPVYSGTSTVNYKDPGWKTKLLEIKEQQNKVSGQILKDAIEYQQFMEATKAFGLQGPGFGLNGYATIPPNVLGGGVLPAYGSGYNVAGTVQFGANANTQYGYTLQAVSGLYGDLNVNQIYQQAAQLTQQAQTLGGQANTQFQALVGQAGSDKARLAEILAKGQVATQVIQALAAPSTLQTSSFKFSISPTGMIQRDDSGVDQPTKTAIDVAWQQVAGQRCAACHDPAKVQGGKPKGGFDITKYPAMTIEEKNAVWGAITNQDAKKRMPLAADGGPGVPLTQEELKTFVVR